MQILKQLVLVNDSCLGIQWDSEEDEFYDSFLPESESFAIQFGDQAEVINRAQIHNRTLVCDIASDFLKEGMEVVVSNICPETGEKDGSLHLSVGQDEELDEGVFNSILYEMDLEGASPEVLKMVMYLLQENKQLVADNYELRGQLQQMEVQLVQSQESSPEEKNYFFPSSKFFHDWVLEKFEEIERGATLLHQNYPRSGLPGLKKRQVDFLFQDINQHYLLVETMFKDRRICHDPMLHLVVLQTAREYLSQVMSVPEHHIRTMLVSNSEGNGVCDLCAINGVEILTIGSRYQIQRHC